MVVDGVLFVNVVVNYLLAINRTMDGERFMKEKTPEIRAKELYGLVYGVEETWRFDHHTPQMKVGWTKLGKLVLRLEKRIQHK